MFRKTCPIGLQRPALKLNGGGAKASLRVVIGSCQSCQGANKVQPRFENNVRMRKDFLSIMCSNPRQDQLSCYRVEHAGLSIAQSSLRQNRKDT